MLARKINNDKSTKVKFSYELVKYSVSINICRIRNKINLILVGLKLRPIVDLEYNRVI